MAAHCALCANAISDGLASVLGVSLLSVLFLITLGACILRYVPSGYLTAQKENVQKVLRRHTLVNKCKVRERTQTRIR